MNAFGEAFELHLRALVGDLFATVEGVPADVLNTWKPAAARAGGHEMNTFAAVLIHVVSAGEFMTLHAVGGEPSNRVREREFEATGEFSEIRARYDAWLTGVHNLLATLTYADLERPVEEPRYRERRWRVAEVLLHALDHTSLHVGHLQVQRQLWDYEQAG